MGRIVKALNYDIYVPKDFLNPVKGQSLDIRFDHINDGAFKVKNASVRRDGDDYIVYLPDDDGPDMWIATIGCRIWEEIPDHCFTPRGKTQYHCID